MMNEPGNSSTWCCIQAGHREQYAIPRALQRVGALDRLITDLWIPPGSALARIAVGRLGRRMNDRFHRDLPIGKVAAFPGRALAWEAFAVVRRWQGARRVLARNDWWSLLAARALRQSGVGEARYLFSYCYEARALFTGAHKAGWIPVLGQIDPGPEEDRKVGAVVRRWSDYRTSFEPGTSAYYENWRQECRLARHIVVNSEWSRLALEKTGIESEKIEVIPLVYVPPPEAKNWQRNFPDKFSVVRPLRVLFLGQCILRKGIAETIEAALKLSDRPVEFTFVGNTDIANLASHFGRARIRHFPRISRAECQEFYKSSDVFLFPTHSDGFGLTQLEAQAWRLPIIASRFCGEVVNDGVTGWILPEVSSEAIIASLEQILASPALLADRSAAIVPWSFDLEQLGRRLVNLGKPVPIHA